MKRFVFQALFYAPIRGSIHCLLVGALLTLGCTPKAHVSEDVPQLAEKPSTAPPSDLQRLEAIADSAARTQLETGSVPGMSVAVARYGEVLFAKGYGQADVEMGVAAGPETAYVIGSITKQMTAATILRLAEAGKISLDDAITKHLPDYPSQGHHVTVRHLLNHTSGIKGFRILHEENRQKFRLDLTYEEMVDLFGKQPFDFKPGKKFEYNNMAYYLLGEIIGRVTGTPWSTYVEKELLQPLGLKQTLYCESRRIIPNRAEGYEYEEGRLVNARYISMQVGGAAGALSSTLNDLIRWTHLLHSWQVVSQESLQQMMTPTIIPAGDTIGYGFGLYLDALGGNTKVGHGGGANGFTAALTHYSEEGLTIAVLTNSNKANPFKVEEALAREALKVKLLDLPLAAEEMVRYEGTYTYQSEKRTRAMRVFSENGQLKAQVVGGKPFRLLYQGEHAFIPEVDDDDCLVFSMVNGRAEGYKHHEGRWKVFPAKRKP
ncbi:hypothetical protein GCM10027443_07120 [Pontibacter brevis]